MEDLHAEPRKEIPIRVWDFQVFDVSGLVHGWPEYAFRAHDAHGSRARGFEGNSCAMLPIVCHKWYSFMGWRTDAAETLIIRKIEQHRVQS